MSVALPAWYGEFYSCRRHWSCTRIKATLHTGLTRQARSKYWNAIDDWQIVHIYVLLYSSTCLVNMNHQVQFCLQSVLQVTLPWPIKVNVTKSSANRIIDKIYYLLTCFLLHFHFCFSFACIIDRRDSYICQIFGCKKTCFRLSHRSLISVAKLHLSSSKFIWSRVFQTWLQVTAEQL